MTLICRYPIMPSCPVVQMPSYTLDLVMVHLTSCSGEHWIISDPHPEGYSGVYTARENGTDSIIISAVPHSPKKVRNT